MENTENKWVLFGHEEHLGKHARTPVNGIRVSKGKDVTRLFIGEAIRKKYGLEIGSRLDIGYNREKPSKLVILFRETGKYRLSGFKNCFYCQQPNKHLTYSKSYKKSRNLTVDFFGENLIEFTI